MCFETFAKKCFDRNFTGVNLHEELSGNYVPKKTEKLMKKNGSIEPLHNNGTFPDFFS